MGNGKIDIKRFVGNNHLGEPNQVEFQFFRQGYFYYSVEDIYSSDWFEFPVPLEDIGTATMRRKDKAITFMPWIRKAIDDKTFIRQ